MRARLRTVKQLDQKGINPMNKAAINSTLVYKTTDVDTGHVSSSKGYLTYPRGMNEACLFSKEYMTSFGVSYRIEVFKYYSKELVWEAYRLNRAPGGYIRWEKIPTFTRAEEKAFPMNVAKQANEFITECRAIMLGTGTMQLTFAI